jgi:hypothetical protein
MATRNRWNEMQAKYEAVDKETCQRHLAAFVKSFVVREKRERWVNILLNKPDKARRDGHNIIGDLDRDRCSFISSNDLAKRKHKGVYYEFSDKALWLPVEDALSVGQQVDAIFSLEEGRLAIFFNHEFRLFEEWIFTK